MDNEKDQEQLSEEELDELAQESFVEEMQKQLQRMMFGVNRHLRRWRGSTPEHNPDKKKGKGYTKPVYNFDKEKKRRKIAKASQRKNRR